MKVIPEIVTAHRDHIPLIAARVREADRQELWASGLHGASEVMHQGIDISEVAWTGLIDGVPVCMFGVAPVTVIGGLGRPWMVGTDMLDKHQMVFLRRCREYVDFMLQMYPVLENYVDARNVQAVKWLMWLGFSFSEPELMGPFSLPFCRFEKRSVANV
jgi:hypothetical protein